jgi:aminoglycoside 6'-N-acetyltransferase
VGLLSYRAATEADVPLLVGWHADPDVSRYWDGETFTEDEMRARLARPDVDLWILTDGGEPVGLLQSWWEPGRPRRGGIDGFLIPSARGRGVMPTIARQLAADLLAQGWAEVTVDPYEWNTRAIRGWEKAGFVEVSRGHPPDEDHSAEWVLMRFSG